MAHLIDELKEAREDITRSKDEAAALQEKSDVLETKVKERTGEAASVSETIDAMSAEAKLLKEEVGILMEHRAQALAREEEYVQMEELHRRQQQQMETIQQTMEVCCSRMNDRAGILSMFVGFSWLSLL